MKPRDIIANARKEIDARVSRVREQISKLKNERDAIENAPLPLNEIRQRIQEFVKSEGSGFADALGGKLSGFLYPNRSHADVTAFEKFIPNLGIAGADMRVDLADLLAFLLGPQIVDKLYQGVEALNLEHGPPMADRPVLVKAIDDQLWDLEVEEEEIIVEAQQAGFSMLRREDCDPRVVLEVERN